MPSLIFSARTLNYNKRMTFTGFIGTVCMFPLRAIIAASVALRIHPNTLTLIGVLINVGAAVALGREHFIWVGLMERPERIVLFMIGAFTNRMAAVLWVILILSIVTVANRIHYTYLALNKKPMPGGSNPLSIVFWRAFFWRDERGTLAYDLWV